MEKKVIVHSVCYDTDRQNDCIGAVMRFRRRLDAERFAAENTLYGHPATVTTEQVPARIAARWSFCG